MWKLLFYVSIAVIYTYSETLFFQEHPSKMFFSQTNFLLVVIFWRVKVRGHFILYVNTNFIVYNVVFHILNADPWLDVKVKKKKIREKLEQ